jgi:7-cyano-7-deazaguanine synthase in queuosine biosynthesis
MNLAKNILNMEEKLIECKRCLFTSDIARMTETQCEYCDIHDELERQAVPLDFEKQLSKVRKRKGKYNCIIGISGGKDSSAMLYAAVKWWNLRPLVIHFDNNWNTDIAKQNMDHLIKTLGVDAINYRVNKREYDILNDAFLCAGVPDADIPNDIAMTKLMYETADKYCIKYILNGHDFREEGSTPRGWTYMDAEYIRSVYEWYTMGDKLINYPLFTFKDQIIYSLKGIKQIRPFHYMTDRTKLEDEMIEFCKWQSYGGKHAENIYTEFVGSVLLPNKFKIDKRIVYYSAMVRTGTLDKQHAKELIAYKKQIDMSKFKDIDIGLISNLKQTHKDFRTYNFKKYRPLIWLMAKMKIVPYTFYKKYCFK